jgi:hypothetical protein
MGRRCAAVIVGFVFVVWWWDGARYVKATQFPFAEQTACAHATILLAQKGIQAYCVPDDAVAVVPEKQEPEKEDFR